MVEPRRFVLSLLVVTLLAAPARAQDDLPPPADVPADEAPYTPAIPDDESLPVTPVAKPAPRAAPAPKAEKPVAKPLETLPSPSAFESIGGGEELAPFGSSPASRSGGVPAPAPAPAPPAAAAPAAKPAAAKKAPTTAANRGVINAEVGTIFKDPDFDADVIATAKPGQVFDISVGKKGPFYKIRLKPGVTGWISDADIRPIGKGPSAAAAKNAKGAKGKKAAKKDVKAKPIAKARYRGLALDFINFAEDTMGQLRTESLLFYGARFSGNGLMFDQMYTDTEILFHLGAPKYYGDATGRSADGLIIIGNFLMITEVPQSKNVMAYYGFGPMFRFSQFRTELVEKGKAKGYELTDATIGAIFGAGVAVAVGDKYAVRLDARYYWETQRYTSLGLAFQTEF